nr:MAG TPA: hypothetical protein [Caudoviricetes sp.]
MHERKEGRKEVRRCPIFIANIEFAPIITKECVGLTAYISMSITAVTRSLFP